MPIKQETAANGLVYYQIELPNCQARIARQGAHVLSFKHRDFSESLWLSQDSAFEPGKAVRGGVPICWPWFGKAKSPGHGFARNCDWQLVEQSEHSNSATLVFELTDSMVAEQSQQLGLGVQPEFAFRLQARFTFGDSLQMQLSTFNPGDQPITYSGALHSYFAAQRASLALDGLGARYFDSTQGGVENAESQFALSDETDRIYPDAASRVTLDTGSHSVKIESSGNDSVVVWNAGKQLVDNMADMHRGAELEYICVEAAITQTPQVVAPGEKHTLSQVIAVW